MELTAAELEMWIERVKQLENKYQEFISGMTTEYCDHDCTYNCEGECQRTSVRIMADAIYSCKLRRNQGR